MVLEGGEACGKSTQAALLAERIDAVLTREPGGTAAGEHIRALLLDPSHPAVVDRTEALLMLAARAQHVAEVIEPALASGRHVVCDRYDGSTVAYQGYGRGLDPGDLAQMSRWAAAGLEPDRVVLIEVGPDEARTRRAGRGDHDRMEQEGPDFFARIAAGFSALAKADPDRWRRIDGVGPVAEVATRIWSAVDDLF